MEYWKWKAIDKLKDYEALKAAVQSIPDEIATLKSEAKSIKSATEEGTAVSGGGSKREDRLLSNIVKREELSGMLERAKLTTGVIERGLSVLSEKERHVLSVMYIERQPDKVGTLRNEFCFADDRSVYKVVDKALLHFTKALYGCTET